MNSVKISFICRWGTITYVSSILWDIHNAGGRIMIKESMNYITSKFQQDIKRGLNF